jgi:hypothetical protein
VQTQQSNPTVETSCLKHAYARRLADGIGFFLLRKANRAVISCHDHVASDVQQVEPTALSPDTDVVTELQTQIAISTIAMRAT